MNVNKNTTISKDDLKKSLDIIEKIKKYCSEKIVGQERLKKSLLVSVIANGHILLESVPGLAKTTAAKALTDAAYVMTKEAIKLFMKKDVEVEQDRDADIRQNSVYLRTAYLVALVDATKIAKITKTA